MGSLEATEQRKELSVLVTGFGPFKEAYPVNPAWKIAERLPDYLPADRAKDAVAAHRSPANVPPVRIVKLPGPVHTSYEYTRALVPTLWGDGDNGHGGHGGHDERADGIGLGRIDYAVHIGMAGPQLVYSLERRGHRDGYDSRDVDGKLLEDEPRRAQEGERWIWHGVPEELLSDLDVDDVHRRWVERSPKNLSLRVSEDAGHYLCDFIYFSSLAHLWKQQRQRKVAFLHVPLHSDPESINRGVELVLTLIRSIVESELEKKQEKQETEETSQS
ncbi:putative pyroglutamyl peptidase type I [Xylaria sp. CBS 124048]|nr:putative pyroglutamyl peptidase type I [Xylaria sp. CBS 124048]